jgi:hypothetical protein
MRLDLTDAEREFLQDLLEASQTSMLHEIHHTDSHQYRQLLERRLALLEGLLERVGSAQAASPAG